MMKVSEILDRYTDFLISNSKIYYTEEYDDVIGIEDMENNKEDFIKEFLFKEFTNIYPNEIIVRV